MLVLQFLVLASGCLALAFDIDQARYVHDDIVASLSLPGFNFRRVKAFSSTAADKSVRNHIAIKRIPGHNLFRRRSAASFIATQKRGARTGVGNVTNVDRYDSQYVAQVFLDGTPMQLVLDTGSADTWVRGSHFQCLNDPNGTQPSCNLGAAFPHDFSDGPIHNQHFAIDYGNGESMAGPLGYMNISVAGLTIPDQEVAMASQGSWYGNNFSSGVLGMAYPSLTSAYWGNNLSDTSSFLETFYSPVVNSMINAGIIEPYWCLAINRNSSSGLFSLGGLPPVDLSQSYSVLTPLLIANLANKDVTAYKPSFYTIVPKAFQFGQQQTTSEYPFILDSGTTLNYLPPDLAELVNSMYDPAAIYLSWYDGYFVPCDASPPRFGVKIEESVFFINPQDMINQALQDPYTGLCQTTISSGGAGPYVLGLTFLQNVLALFNIGSAEIEIFSREFY